VDVNQLSEKWEMGHTVKGLTQVKKDRSHFLSIIKSFRTVMNEG